MSVGRDCIIIGTDFGQLFEKAGLKDERNIANGTDFNGVLFQSIL